MKPIKSIKGRLKRWRERLAPTKYPQRIVIKELNIKPVQFDVYSSVERFRVITYGNEREILERFLALLRPDDIVYDIGASVGLYSITAATLVTQGAICAFEPDPETRARLEHNVALNGFKNVRLLPWALSDKEEEATLYSDGAAGYAPSLAMKSGDRAPSGEIPVQLRTLDSILAHQELPIPDVLKIDIEGAEMFCLNGCKGLLAGEFGNRPRLILVEIHPVFLADFNSSPEEIKQFVADCGYQLDWHDVRSAEEHLCYQLAGSTEVAAHISV